MSHKREFEEHVLRAAENIFIVIGNSYRAFRSSERITQEEIDLSIKKLMKDYPERKSEIKRWDWCHEQCSTAKMVKELLKKHGEVVRKETVREIRRLNPSAKLKTSIYQKHAT